MSCATVKIRVIPRSSKNEIVGWRGNSLLVKVTAPPVEGAANEAVVRMLSDVLGLRKGDIRIVSGERSRDKVIEIKGFSGEQAVSKLLGCS
ncbi:MAG: DUF167 domain-containing protein [Armatimonadota bacterium]